MHLVGNPLYRVPDILETIELTIRLGRLTNPAIRCVGLSINSSSLTQSAWDEYRTRLSGELGLPVCDPLRTGLDPLVAALLER